MKFHTIADYSEKLAGKKVFVRIDTNATLKNGEIPFTERVKSAFETIRYLVDKKACVIAGSHNGRAGDSSFVSIGPLFLLLKQKYPDLPELICPGNTYDAAHEGLNDDAVKAIKNMQEGQVLVLENLRFLVNETAKFSREEFAQQKFVGDLVDAGVEYYVLDGFSIAHRAQMSVVGFPQIPNLAGLSLEKELNGSVKVIELLNKNKTGEEKVAFILGGAKIQDYLVLIENALESNTVSKILTGGLLAQLCLFAKGENLGAGSRKPLEKKDSKGKTIMDYSELIAKLMEKYGDKIELPIDVGYELENGDRKDVALEDIDDEIRNQGWVMDIGPKTAEKYREILSQSSMAYWKGPIGAFDKNPKFATGSEQILSLLRDNDKIFSVMGGGDTGQMLQAFDTTTDQLGYVSLAGGALIQVLAGKELPGFAALEQSYQKFNK